MIVLVLAFLSLLINVHIYVYVKKSGFFDKNLYLPYTISIFFAFLFVMTEVLSYFRSITLFNLLFIWIFFILVNVILCYLNIRRLDKYGLNDTISVHFLINRIREIPKPLLVYIIFCFFMLVLAYNTTPYNSDSISCHLARIVHWGQNRDVRHFSSHNTLQNCYPVVSGYIQLHNYILSGYSDKYICLTQCFSYILDGILIYNTSRIIGCSKKWGYVATIIFISLPVTFGEALNTQVDLITPLFVLSATIIIVELCMSKDNIDISPPIFFNASCIGVCSALAFLSKYTAVFAIIPFCVWLLIVCKKNKTDFRVVLFYAGIIIIIALLLFMPEAVRLKQTFGTVFPSYLGSAQVIDTTDPRLIFLLFIEHLCYNLSGHYFYNSDKMLTRFVEKVALMLNVDTMDPRITLSYSDYEVSSPFTYHHDLANGNLITFLFLLSIVVIIITLIYSRVKNKELPYKKAVGYIVSSYVAFIMFSSICMFTIRRSRYLIVFFALLCPAVCYLYQKCETLFQNHVQSILTTIIVFVSVCEIISLSIYHCNQIAYIGDRPTGYFGGHVMFEGHYKSVELIKDAGYKTIGLINGFVFEYPLWAMMHGYVDRIEDVNVHNPSSIHEDMSYYPDAVLQIDTKPITENSINVHGIDYSIISKFNDEYGYYALAESPNWIAN